MLRISKTFVLVVASFAIITTLNAEVKVASLFGDNMILQQKTKNTFWGWADPGEKVTIKASWGATASATAGNDGKWKLFLDTPGYGTGYSIQICGKNKIDIKNVAIGEVWLCAGQSNMGWSTGNSFGGEEESESANDPDYRIYKSQREHWHEPLEISRDRLAKWKLCDKESSYETSVVSYYFGKKLRKELGIPVGIIVKAFAGTPIEGWMPWDIQKDDPRAIEYKAALDENAKRVAEKQGITKEKAIAKFNKELAAYNKKIDAGETMKNKVKKLSPPIITKPSNLGHQYPGNIFNGMINPILPYGIRGVIWYQGERNSKNVPQAVNYRKQLALLIRYYREIWHEMSGGNVAKDFQFQFTQLPSWNPEQTKPVEGLEAPWAINREMMRLVTQDVPNTGMAVSIDVGDPIALHPKNKKPIGIRHAYIALKEVYGKDFVSYGPKYKSQKIEGNKIVLTFDSIGSGMVRAKNGKLNAFAIAGADKKWYWADAEIKGDTIAVSSKDVPKPVAVRYAWGMNPSQRNLLYNKEGIPASPFRTDNWKLFNPNDEIVTVNKPAKPKVKKEAKDWLRPKMTQ